MASGKNLGVDLGTSGGDWLYRQEGLVLGPIPGTRIVEMLFASEIDGRTEIAPMGSSQFKPLAEVDFFKVHFAKAEAKRRVDVAAASDRAAQAKKRTIRMAAVGVLALILVVAAGATAKYLAIHNPWKDADELALADLGFEITVSEVTVAQKWVREEELLDYPGATRPPPPKVAQKPSEPAAQPAGTGTEAAAQKAVAAVTKPGQAAPPTPVTPPKASTGKPSRAEKKLAAATTRTPKVNDPTEEPDGMQMAQFDQAAINAVVAAHQKKLFPCFIAEAKRTPDLSAKIPLEFVIGNDGRVAKLWVDNPRFKTGPLFECLFTELKKFPFKPYEGERATVNLSFNIGQKR